MSTTSSSTSTRPNMSRWPRTTTTSRRTISSIMAIAFAGVVVVVLSQWTVMVPAANVILHLNSQQRNDDGMVASYPNIQASSRHRKQANLADNPLHPTDNANVNLQHQHTTSPMKTLPHHQMQYPPGAATTTVLNGAMAPLPQLPSAPHNHHTPVKLDEAEFVDLQLLLQTAHPTHPPPNHNSRYPSLSPRKDGTNHHHIITNMSVPYEEATIEELHRRIRLATVDRSLGLWAGGCEEVKEGGGGATKKKPMRSSSRHVRLLMGIPSVDKRDGAVRRDLQRRSWMQYPEVLNSRGPNHLCTPTSPKQTGNNNNNNVDTEKFRGSVLVRFLLGRHHIPDPQTPPGSVDSVSTSPYQYSPFVKYEAAHNRDMLLLDLDDGKPTNRMKRTGTQGHWGLETEVGMSRKALYWYVLALRHFSFDYIMKGDDDSFFRVPLLIQELYYTVIPNSISIRKRWREKNEQEGYFNNNNTGIGGISPTTIPTSVKQQQDQQGDRTYVYWGLVFPLWTGKHKHTTKVENRKSPMYFVVAGMGIVMSRSLVEDMIVTDLMLYLVASGPFKYYLPIYHHQPTNNTNNTNNEDHVSIISDDNNSIAALLKSLPSSKYDVALPPPLPEEEQHEEKKSFLSRWRSPKLQEKRKKLSGNGGDGKKRGCSHIAGRPVPVGTISEDHPHIAKIREVSESVYDTLQAHHEDMMIGRSIYRLAAGIRPRSENKALFVSTKTDGKVLDALGVPTTRDCRFEDLYKPWRQFDDAKRPRHTLTNNTIVMHRIKNRDYLDLKGMYPSPLEDAAHVAPIVPDRFELDTAAFTHVTISEGLLYNHTISSLCPVP